MTEYLLDVSKKSDEELSLWYSQMSKQRQEKCNRYLDEKAKKLCIGADHLIRTALSEQLHCSPQQISITVTPDGKPYVEKNPVYFSYSHSYPYVVAVISDHPIGVDLEAIRTVNATPERICTKKEIEYLNNAVDSNDYNQRFISIWTKKEAIFKIDGNLPREDKKTETLTPDREIKLTTKSLNNFILTIAEKIQS